MNNKLSSFRNLKIVPPIKKFLMAPDPTSAGPTDLVGMEIELENIPITTAWAVAEAEERLAPYWKVAVDRSLKNNGREFISCPVFGQDVRQALTVLNDYFSAHKFKPDRSPRAGLHIHMDVGDMTAEEFVRFLEVYIIVEPVLYAFSGAGRDNNIFCLPWYKTKGVLNGVASLAYSLSAATEDSIFNNIPTLFKYSGLNLRPIIGLAALPMEDNDDNKTGGHIEFRMAPAEYETEEVLAWINVLLCLKTYAKNPSERIPDSAADASKLDGVQYFHSIFKYLNKDHMSIFLGGLEGREVSRLMAKGMRVLSYFKVIKILKAYTKSLIDQEEFLFKNTHPGFMKYRDRIKKPAQVVIKDGLYTFADFMQ